MSLNLISHVISRSLILLIVGGIPLFGCFKKVNVFETFIEGAQEGFALSVRIMPYMVAFLVVIGLFRAGGGFTLLAQTLGHALQRIGIPSDILPLALIRPFSGSASISLLAELAKQHGGHSMIAHIGATLLGSTETTLYVATVYFAAAQITRSRHAILCGLIADGVGVLAACWVVRLMA